MLRGSIRPNCCSRALKCVTCNAAIGPVVKISLIISSPAHQSTTVYGRIQSTGHGHAETYTNGQKKSYRDYVERLFKRTTRPRSSRRQYRPSHRTSWAVAHQDAHGSSTFRRLRARLPFRFWRCHVRHGVGCPGRAGSSARTGPSWQFRDSSFFAFVTNISP